jgi:hypothetical protein
MKKHLNELELRLAIHNAYKDILAAQPEDSDEIIITFRATLNKSQSYLADTASESTLVYRMCTAYSGELGITWNITPICFDALIWGEDWFETDAKNPDFYIPLSKIIDSKLMRSMLIDNILAELD